MAKGTYWLPKGTVVKWNHIEVILDDDSNSVLIEESDWPEIQRAHFPREDWDDPQFDETEASEQAAAAARERSLLLK